MQQLASPVFITDNYAIGDNEIADILLRHFEVQTGSVDFDVSSGGYLRGATITIKNASTENYDLGEVNVSQ